MPARKKVSDEAIVELVREGLGMNEICRRLGFKSLGSTARIHQVARAHGLKVKKAPNVGNRMPEQLRAEARFVEHVTAEGRKHFPIDNGTVLIGSDSHYWPGIISTAHRAFVHFIRELKPSAVVKNGDAFDGAQISRHARIGWEHRPDALQELKACQERMTEIAEAANHHNLFWPCGNHDARFETFLANVAPQFQGVDGFRLKDHFPEWKPCWSVWFNQDVVVKHRLRGGIHATHNNTVHAGKTTITGHLHSLRVTPFSDYNGTRWGVDCGTLAQPYGPQFNNYCEDAPVNWRSGFVVLTFWKGMLLDPETVRVIDEEQGLVTFRGQVIQV